MAFIWRSKPHTTKSPLPPMEAITCLEAGYILVPIGQEAGESLSFNLHVLLGLALPLQELSQVVAALKPESQTRLQQSLAALRQGQVTNPLQLYPSDGNITLSCKTYVVPGAEEGSRLGVLWLCDTSPEGRQQQRLTQENEKLKSEIKHYSTILNMAPYPIWQRDGEMNMRYYNLAYSEVAEAEDANHSPELDRKERALAAAALDSGMAKAERRHIVVGGQRKLFSISELPLPQEKMVIGFAQDASEIETLQEELQRYISAQSDLLESSASAMAIYGADMRLKSYNYAFAALWKLEEGWLDSQPSYGEILEALREKRKLPEQANFAHFKQQQLRMFTDLIEPREEFFYLPDGKALRVIVIPHALGGILFAYEDVTDRLALERSYNTLIAVQRETLDHLHEGIAVFGEDGRLKLSNPVYLAMWGIDAQVARTEPHITDLIDRTKELYQFDQWETFRHSEAAQIQRRELTRKRIERRDGKVIDCTIVPLPDGATLMTYLDVTDSTLVERSLRERNEALQEADRLKSEFLANVSYELRSPLTSISGFAELLGQEYFGSITEKQREYIDGIHLSSQHLMQIINDILDLASIEAGYMQLEVTRFDIYDMMQSVLPLVQERIKEFEINFQFECPKKIGAMVGDETRLRQLLFKLLSNAIKFSSTGTSVVFGASEEEDGRVALWVADQGYGIPLEEQEAVFEKFYKGRNADAPKSIARTGTGLGLSIVKSFVDLHGGAIVMDSGRGAGTRIRCIFPRENPELLAQLRVKPTRKRTASKATKESNGGV